jgi:hypothetical protein
MPSPYKDVTTSGGIPRSRTIALRLTPQERTTYEYAALREGHTLSSWIRHILRQTVQKANRAWSEKKEAQVRMEGAAETFGIAKKGLPWIGPVPECAPVELVRVRKEEKRRKEEIEKEDRPVKRGRKRKV